MRWYHSFRATRPNTDASAIGFAAVYHVVCRGNKRQKIFRDVSIVDGTWRHWLTIASWWRPRRETFPR